MYYWQQCSLVVYEPAAWALSRSLAYDSAALVVAIMRACALLLLLLLMRARASAAAAAVVMR